jgi:FMN-dependent oxidoreductase (nitrilotriacetate monooxygenase family)
MRWLGYHSKAWRHPDVPADGAMSFQYHLANARKAEAAKFDMIFFADGLAVRASDNPPGSLCRDDKIVELEPITLLSAIAACTKHIGLIATASTSYNEPFHVARKFASLDHISGGRAGWNVVTSWSQQEAWNFNRDAHFEYGERYERAAEFAEVVTGLWNSWEADAFIRNKETGIYYDQDKLHVLNHIGKHFKVRGPLTCARTPQGRPLIVQAGSSDQGVDIAGKYADVVYANIISMEEGKKAYSELKARAVAHGRTPGDVLYMPGISVHTANTRAEAQEKFDRLQELIDPISGMSLLTAYIGDVTKYSVDDPLPNPVSPNMVHIARQFKRAKEQNLTIKDAYRHLGAAISVRYLVGTPKDIADQMQEWFESGAADGFNICPPTRPQGVDDFIDLVVPELQRRKLFRTEYEGSNLRENLGLRPIP